MPFVAAAGASRGLEFGQQELGSATASELQISGCARPGRCRGILHDFRVGYKQKTKKTLKQKNGQKAKEPQPVEL